MFVHFIPVLKQITTLKVDAIIRRGLHRFTDMIGKLWVSLADYYIRAGHFESARDVYEEAMATVTMVRTLGKFLMPMHNLRRA